MQLKKLQNLKKETQCIKLKGKQKQPFFENILLFSEKPEQVPRNAIVQKVETEAKTKRQNIRKGETSQS